MNVQLIDYIGKSYENFSVIVEQNKYLSNNVSSPLDKLTLKCRYMDELTGGKGIIFATGTPISNSITELYTIQRYLQYDALSEKKLLHFDAWASTFGETQTSIELAPEGLRL